MAGLVAATVIGSAQLHAQLPRPLIPLPGDGNRVAPFFDGWYENPDGTTTLSFGFSNLNKDKVVEIPLGPDNVITPKEYDGRQPTSFPVFGPDNADGGGSGAGRPPAVSPATAAARAPGAGGGTVGSQRDRDRGVFTVTVPAGYKGDVVWTLRYAGQTHSVPARSRSTSYQLSWPAAMGSTPPPLRFAEKGEAGRGPTGIMGPALQAKVGAPIELKIWLTDDAARQGAHQVRAGAAGNERDLVQILRSGRRRL